MPGGLRVPSRQGKPGRTLVGNRDCLTEKCPRKLIEHTSKHDTPVSLSGGSRATRTATHEQEFVWSPGFPRQGGCMLIIRYAHESIFNMTRNSQTFQKTRGGVWFAVRN